MAAARQAASCYALHALPRSLWHRTYPTPWTPKFHELHAVRPNSVTEQALARIGELYDIEREIRGKPPDLRREIRQREAVPRLASLRAWLEETAAKLSRKSDTTAAILYTLKRWDAFTRYAGDGRLEIDNNSAERALRAVALGRKNYFIRWRR